MTRNLIAIAILVSTGSTASAHGGHIGELAGHSHWVGIAAVLGAAALAALVARAKKRNDEALADDAEPESDSVDDPEGASA